MKEMLRGVGLRPTQQRVALASMLFKKGNRHVTAEMLYQEAIDANIRLSLATIYNVLHQFTKLGLLRHITVDGSKTYFDTNVSDHHHMFIEQQNELRDIPLSVMRVQIPEAPDGYEVVRIDVVVRMHRSTN
jgi:Fur family transcriptional regulator, iron response regulator